MVIGCCLIFGLALLAGGRHPALAAGSASPSASSTAGLICRTPFALSQVKLKDHSLFAYAGWYYLVSIRIDVTPIDNHSELQFAYARTRDFCAWEELASPLRHGSPGDPDEAYVWAPYVFTVGDTYYMYYTGVNLQIAQTIMLATSTNPADPQSWQKQGVVFRPEHPGAIYPGPAQWSDCRDPMVLAYNGRYYLYYSGVDVDGSIVGVAVADSPAGPWHDLGATYRAPASENVPESAYVLEQNGWFYLFYHATGATDQGERYRWSASPFGPWQPARAVGPGWAYDFYHDTTGWLATYLVGNGASINVDQVRWQPSDLIDLPQIGQLIYLPAVRR